MSSTYWNDIVIDNPEYLRKYLRSTKDYTVIFLIRKDPVNWLESIANWGVKCNWIDSFSEVRNKYWRDWLKEYDAYYDAWSHIHSYCFGTKVVIIDLLFEEGVSDPARAFDAACEVAGNRIFVRHRNLKWTDVWFDNVPVSEKRKISDLRRNNNRSLFADMAHEIYEGTPSFIYRRLYGAEVGVAQRRA